MAALECFSSHVTKALLDHVACGHAENSLAGVENKECPASEEAAFVSLENPENRRGHRGNKFDLSFAEAGSNDPPSLLSKLRSRIRAQGELHSCPKRWRDPSAPAK